MNTSIRYFSHTESKSRFFPKYDSTRRLLLQWLCQLVDIDADTLLFSFLFYHLTKLTVILTHSVCLSLRCAPVNFYPPADFHSHAYLETTLYMIF